MFDLAACNCQSQILVVVLDDYRENAGISILVRRFVIALESFESLALYCQLLLLELVSEVVVEQDGLFDCFLQDGLFYCFLHN